MGSGKSQLSCEKKVWNIFMQQRINTVLLFFSEINTFFFCHNSSTYKTFLLVSVRHRWLINKMPHICSYLHDVLWPACMPWMVLFTLIKNIRQKKDSIAFFPPHFLCRCGTRSWSALQRSGQRPVCGSTVPPVYYRRSDRTWERTGGGKQLHNTPYHFSSFSSLFIKAKDETFASENVRQTGLTAKKKAVSSRRLTFRMSARFKQFQKTEISSSEPFRGDSAKYNRHSQGKYVGTCWFLFLSELHLSPTTILIFI